MKKRIFALTLSAVMAVSMFAACSSTTTEETTETTAAQAETEATQETEATTVATVDPAKEIFIEAEDRSGNAISIPAQVDTIISMAPSTTRFLIDLGLADKIIAIDTNSYTYLDQLSADVQQFDMMNPDNEALVALDPDIIFTSGMSSFGGTDVYQPARDAGICVADIPSSMSVNDIVLDLEFIGFAVGEEDKAAELIDEFKAQYDEICALGATVEDKKTVLFEIGLPSADFPTLYTLGKGTYIDEMITGIGAVNVTGDLDSWVALTEEEAIALNPDVILTNVDYIDDPVSVIKESAGWENVTAVKNGDIYYIDATSSNQPNNHIIDSMIEMAKAVYPDVYKDM